MIDGNQATVMETAAPDPTDPSTYRTFTVRLSQPVDGAATKIHRVLPDALRRQVEALESTLGFTSRPTAGAPVAGGTVLLQFHREPLAANCWELEDLRAELETRT